MKDWPVYEVWAEDWINEIRNLYYLNQRRLRAKESPENFLITQEALEKAIATIRKKIDARLQDKNLGAPCIKVIKSFNRFWGGLTTFVQHCEIPMDNNTAERGIRGSVVGRKNYCGSGSIKSAKLTATMFTIIQTLLIWNINPQKWMSKFFDFIGNDWNRDFEKWLPWNMSPDQKVALAMERKAHHAPLQHKAFEKSSFNFCYFMPNMRCLDQRSSAEGGRNLQITGFTEYLRWS